MAACRYVQQPCRRHHPDAVAFLEDSPPDPRVSRRVGDRAAQRAANDRIRPRGGVRIEACEGPRWPRLTGAGDGDALLLFLAGAAASPRLPLLSRTSDAAVRGACCRVPRERQRGHRLCGRAGGAGELDAEEIIGTIRAGRAPMMHASTGLELWTEPTGSRERERSAGAPAPLGARGTAASHVAVVPEARTEVAGPAQRQQSRRLCRFGDGSARRRRLYGSRVTFSLAAPLGPVTVGNARKRDDVDA